MFKFLFTAVFILAIAYFGLGFMGYQVHPENISYYIPQKSDTGSFKFSDYMDTVKIQNKLHPLIAKKKGVSAAGKTDQGITETMKAVLQVDKINQFEKLKKDIDVIKAKTDDRNKEVNAIMDGMEQPKK